MYLSINITDILQFYIGDDETVDIFDQFGLLVNRLYHDIIDCETNIPSSKILKLKMYNGVNLIDFTNLIYLNCSWNNLNKLIVPESVQVLDCNNNQLNELIVPNSVRELDCSYNQLTELVLPNYVQKLYCGCNQLTELIVPNSVQELCCNHNKLTELTVSKNIKYTNYDNNPDIKVIKE